jgi:SAM-dependent methyltransferase
VPSLYDHPRYYDVLFGWDRSLEAGFYDGALRTHGAPAGGRVLEVACGTGQIALRLAERGWRVTGLDLSPDMLAFLAERAAQAGAAVSTLCADMAAFTCPVRQHAAFSPMSSFRLLLDDAAVGAHLTCVADALRPGGPYVLDLTFGTSGEAEDDLDEWTLARGGIEVRATPHGVDVRDRARGLELSLDWHERLRAYAPRAFEALVAASGRFSVAACYPESGRAADDISTFDLETPSELPAEGRAMVVLQSLGARPGQGA